VNCLSQLESPKAQRYIFIHGQYKGLWNVQIIELGPVPHQSWKSLVSKYKLLGNPHKAKCLKSFTLLLVDCTKIPFLMLWTVRPSVKPFGRRGKSSLMGSTKDCETPESLDLHLYHIRAGRICSVIRLRPNWALRRYLHLGTQAKCDAAAAFKYTYA
jgi:hypothetical protein